MIENLNDLWNSTHTFNFTALILATIRCHKGIVKLLIRLEGIELSIHDILNQKLFLYSNLTFLIVLENWKIFEFLE